MHLTTGRTATLLKLSGQPGVRQFLLEGMSLNLTDARKFLRDGARLKRRTGLGLYLVSESREVIGYAGFIPSRADQARPEIMYALADRFAGLERGTRICAAWR